MEKKMSYLKRGGEFLTKLFLFLMFFYLSAPGARAAQGDTADDPVLIEVGEDGTYTSEAFDIINGKRIYYRFVAPAAGTFKMPAGTMLHWTSNGGQFNSYSVYMEAGEKLDFYWDPSDVSKDPFTFTFTRDTEDTGPIELTSFSPAEGSTLDILLEAIIILNFNQPIQIDKNVFDVDYEGGNFITGGRVEGNDNMKVVVDLAAMLKRKLNNGGIKEGSEIKFIIPGTTIKDLAGKKFFKGDTLTYKIGGLPGNLLSASLGSTELALDATPTGDFLSYYRPNDPEGLMTFKFDKPMGEGIKAALCIGEVDFPASYYREEMPVTVKDSTVTIDFRDKRRVPEELLSLRTGPSVDLTPYEIYNVQLDNVKDIYGTRIQNTTQQGKAGGSFDFNCNLKRVPDAVTAHEYKPDEGASLTGVPEITLWMQDPDAFTFDAVKFECRVINADTVMKENVYVNYDQLKIEPSEDGGATYTIPVPFKQGLIPDSAVVVSLNGLKADDGKDYEKDFTVTYTSEGYIGAVNPEDVPKLATVIPADGSALASLGEGTDNPVVAMSTTNNALVGFVQFDVTDKNPEDSARAVVRALTDMQRKTEGDSVWFETVLAGTTILYEGHTYEIAFRAFGSEEEANNGADPYSVMTATYTGTTRAFRFSDVKFLDIVPADSSTLESPSENEFTLTFSGPVILNDENSFVVRGKAHQYWETFPFESITPSKGDTVWTVKVDMDSLLAIMPGGMMSSVTLGFAPTDTKGFLVEGNTGEKETSYLRFEYLTPFGIPDFTTEPASGSDVDTLEVVRAFYEGGIAPSYNVPNDSVVVYDSEGNAVATLADAVPYIPEDELENFDYLPVEVVLTLNTAITESGTYRLHIPEGFFILGSDTANVNSKAAELVYNVVSHGGQSLTVEPADGSAVASLHEFVFTCGEGIGANPDGTEPIELKDGNGETVASATSLNTDFVFAEDDPEGMPVGSKVTLDKEVTAGGTYTLHVPAGFFLTGENGDVLSEEMTLTYTVNPTHIGGVAADGAEGVTVYTVDGRLVLKSDDASGLKGLKKGVYIVNGKKTLVK